MEPDEVGPELQHVVALAWHDVVCPEGEDCRDRDLHAMSEPVASSGVALRFAMRLAVLGSRLLQKLDPRTVVVDGVTYRVGDEDPTPAIRYGRRWNEERRVWDAPGERGLKDRCTSRDDGYYCTWGWTHPGTPHVAGVDGVIVHVWQDTPAPQPRVDTEYGMSVIISDEMLRRSDPGLVQRIVEDHIEKTEKQVPPQRRGFADGID